jgi:hypothetical protein
VLVVHDVRGCVVLNNRSRPFMMIAMDPSLSYMHGRINLCFRNIL